MLSKLMILLFLGLLLAGCAELKDVGQNMTDGTANDFNQLGADIFK